MSDPLVSLREYIEVDNMNEAWYATFTQEVIDQAEHYELGINPYSRNTYVRLLDAEYQNLGEVDFESSELAIAFVEENFDLDEEDLEWNDSYEWAEDFDDEEADWVDDYSSDANI